MFQSCLEELSTTSVNFGKSRRNELKSSKSKSKRAKPTSCVTVWLCSASLWWPLASLCSTKTTSCWWMETMLRLILCLLTPYATSLTATSLSVLLISNSRKLTSTRTWSSRKINKIQVAKKAARSSKEKCKAWRQTSVRHSTCQNKIKTEANESTRRITSSRSNSTAKAEAQLSGSSSIKTNSLSSMMSSRPLAQAEVPLSQISIESSTLCRINLKISSECSLSGLSTYSPTTRPTRHTRPRFSSKARRWLTANKSRWSTFFSSKWLNQVSQCRCQMIRTLASPKEWRFQSNLRGAGPGPKNSKSMPSRISLSLTKTSCGHIIRHTQCSEKKPQLSQMYSTTYWSQLWSLRTACRWRFEHNLSSMWWQMRNEEPTGELKLSQRNNHRRLKEKSNLLATLTSSVVNSASGTHSAMKAQTLLSAYTWMTRWRHSWFS